MFQLPEPTYTAKDEFYRILEQTADSIFGEETDHIANAANLSSLLYHCLPELNWAGFYFYKDDQLVLGPFQGKPACIRIGMGKGVCGAAAQDRKTLIVGDVHRFPGHIACDADSRSEIVIPIVKGRMLRGVLDLDSPVPQRFDQQDQTGLERLVGKYAAVSEFDARRKQASGARV